MYTYIMYVCISLIYSVYLTYIYIKKKTTSTTVLHNTWLKTLDVWNVNGYLKILQFIIGVTKKDWTKIRWTNPGIITKDTVTINKPGDLILSIETFVFVVVFFGSVLGSFCSYREGGSKGRREAGKEGGRKGGREKGKGGGDKRKEGNKEGRKEINR